MYIYIHILSFYIHNKTHFFVIFYLILTWGYVFTDFIEEGGESEREISVSNIDRLPPTRAPT